MIVLWLSCRNCWRDALLVLEVASLHCADHQFGGRCLRVQHFDYLELVDEDKALDVQHNNYLEGLHHFSEYSYKLDFQLDPFRL